MARVVGAGAGDDRHALRAAPGRRARSRAGAPRRSASRPRRWCPQTTNAVGAVLGEVVQQRGRTPPRRRAPSSSNGVTIAVRMAPRAAHGRCMCPSVTARRTAGRSAMQDRRDRTELALEIAAVRWRLPDGDFAVLVGVTDEGEEVTVTGAAGPRADGRGDRRRAARCAGTPSTAGSSPPRACGCASRSARTRCSAYLRRGQARRAGAARRGCSSATGTSVLAVDRRRPGRAAARGPGDRPAPHRRGGRIVAASSASAARACGCSSTATACPRRSAARVMRAFGAGRDRAAAATTRTRLTRARRDRLRDGRRAGAGARACRRRIRGGWTPGVMHALRWPRTTATATSRAPSCAERARRLLGDRRGRPHRRAGARRAARASTTRPRRRRAAGRDRAAARARGRASCSTRSRCSTLRDRARPDRRLRADRRPMGRGQPGARAAACRSSRAGPGVGKTASMRALVDVAARRRAASVRLCAPTGKAARRLAESDGRRGHDDPPAARVACPARASAATPRDPIDGLRHADRRRGVDARRCAWPSALFDAVGPRTHVLLVGDADQLAPVGAGPRARRPASPPRRCPSTRLTEIFRQAARSLIVRAAHAINHGEPPPTRVRPTTACATSSSIERDGPRRDLRRGRLAGVRAPAAPLRARPAAPTCRCSRRCTGPGRHRRAQRRAARAAEPGRRADPGHRAARRRQGRADRATTTSAQLMNGETGVLVAPRRRPRRRVILATDDGRRVVLDVKELDTFRLGYASSVHKAQGSSGARSSWSSRAATT